MSAMLITRLKFRRRREDVIIRSRIPAMFLAAAIPFLAASCFRTTDPLVIGIVPSESPEVLRDEFRGMENYLETAMERNIDVYVPDDYRELIEAMRNGDVDIGLYGPFSFIVAESRQDLVPLLVRKKKTSGITYNSLIVARSDSDIAAVEDLEDRTMAFVNTASTSGFVIPQSLFISRGIDIDSFLERHYFAGSHDLVVADVLAGRCDAGAVSKTILERLVEKGDVNAGDLKILWESDPIPGSPYVARGDLDSRTIETFTAVMEIVHERDPSALEAFDASIEKYVPVEDGLYDPIRNIVNILGWDFIERNYL